YTTAGRLTRVSGGVGDPYMPDHYPSTLLTSAHYDAAGRLTSDSLGDSAETETFSYTKRGWQQSSNVVLNGNSIYSFNISSFAPNGDVLSVSDSVNGNWTYTY